MITPQTAGDGSMPANCPVTRLGAEFNPFVDPYLADPYAFLARARLEEPTFYSPEIDYYVVTRYADVRDVFRTKAKYSAANALEPLTALYPSSLEKAFAAGLVPDPVLVNEDDPRHMQHRRPLADRFIPANLEPFGPRIRDLVTRYLDTIVKNGEADLIADLAWEVPALVALFLMGVPDEEAARVKRFAAERTLFTWGRPTEEEQNRLVDDVTAYWDYCREHVARMMANPGDDHLSDAIRVHQADPELMDENYVHNTMLNGLFAAHETTTGALGNLFRALLERPATWDRVCADPALIPRSIEEGLRYSSSVIAWRRRALTTTEIGGVTIPEGANLLLMIASANHDDDMFPDPDTFDIDRANAHRHLAFGFGSHVCLGASLARLEMRIVLEELTRRLPHLELTQQHWQYSPNTSFRGPLQLTVRWDPADNPVPADRP